LETISKRIDISLKESISGVKRKVEIEHFIRCSCVKECPECKGNGYIQKTSVQKINNAQFVQSYQQECTDCKTSGHKCIDLECVLCGQTRKTKKSVRLEIDIPLRTFHDFKTTIKHPDQPNCQIQFTVAIVFSEGFSRSNNDLMYVIKPTVTDAFLGTCYQIPHPSGEIVELDYTKRLDVVNNNTILSIKNKGILPNSNLVVKFQVQYPSTRVGNVSADARTSFKESMKTLFNM
jgi:DnaJ-class molecular chaperone